MNESYTSFAQVYDMFMDNVDYSAWSKYLIQLLKEYQVEDGLVLDLGCGTGNMTELLAKEGYDMIGVDNSEDMLEIASEKRAESGLNILYLLQDMREFELYGTVKAVVSICDSINYILEEDDVASSQMRIETMTRDFSIEEMNYLVKMIEGIREMRKAYEQNDKIG